MSLCEIDGVIRKPVASSSTTRVTLRNRDEISLSASGGDRWEAVEIVFQIFFQNLRRWGVSCGGSDVFSNTRLSFFLQILSFFLGSLPKEIIIFLN